MSIKFFIFSLYDKTPVNPLNVVSYLDDSCFPIVVPILFCWFCCGLVNGFIFKASKYSASYCDVTSSVIVALSSYISVFA